VLDSLSTDQRPYALSNDVVLNTRRIDAPEEVTVSDAVQHTTSDPPIITPDHLLCTPQQFRRFTQVDPNGVALRGVFWGRAGKVLDRRQFCLSAEDAARGVLTLGVPGAGKTQAVMLPLIAEHLRAGHSLIVADPQGELGPYLMQLAVTTAHTLAVHDPTRPDSLRFNLAQDIATVSDARALASVLVPLMPGDNRFWSEAAIALLAASLLRYPSLGAVFSALSDLKALSRTLAQVEDDAYLLAHSFIAGVRYNEWKLAANVVATLAASLTGWAAHTVRQSTANSDFSADLLIQKPTIVVLTCPARTRHAFAPYLGAVLYKLILDLDTLGQHCGGPLPLPVAVVLDEFPTLGRLDGLLANINLMRKRRIMAALAAQTISQIQWLYGQTGAEVLLSGFATQVVFGGGDLSTAANYSGAIARVSLLPVEAILSPPQGNCTIFIRFVDGDHAAQVVLRARLRRFYESGDQ
jgi:type IV secretory pathway TraG/TraD family ATPase VirD4